MKLIKKEGKETIELKGKIFDEFEKNCKIKEVILLGETGEVRRILIE